MATSNILTNVKITDPHKAELFVNALEASSKDPKWVPTSEVKQPLTDSEAIKALVLKNDNSSVGRTWNEAMNELFTSDEIFESNLRVALIGEIAKAHDEKNISPTQHEHIMEMFSDYILYKEAKKRIDNNISSENISHEALMKELNITQDDLDDVAVEFE